MMSRMMIDTMSSAVRMAENIAMNELLHGALAHGDGLHVFFVEDLVDRRRDVGAIAIGVVDAAHDPADLIFAPLGDRFVQVRPVEEELRAIDRFRRSLGRCRRC